MATLGGSRGLPSGWLWYGVCTQGGIAHVFECGDVDLADQRDADRISHVRTAIVRYLRGNPHAGDTPAGIVACWLPARSYADAPLFIEAVIDTMVAAGELAPRRLPDGRILYVRGPALTT